MGLIVLHVHGAMSHIAVKRSLLPIRLQVSCPAALQRMLRARRNCLDAAAGHMGRVPYWGTLCRCSADSQATPDLGEKAQASGVRAQAIAQHAQSCRGPG